MSENEGQREREKDERERLFFEFFDLQCFFVCSRGLRLPTETVEEIYMR